MFGKGTGTSVRGSDAGDVCDLTAIFGPASLVRSEVFGYVHGPALCILLVPHWPGFAVLLAYAGCDTVVRDRVYSDLDKQLSYGLRQYCPAPVSYTHLMLPTTPYV
jgi:hypothetical protein